VRPLERRYRRLLAAYPDDYRRENAEEILAVLMAGAAAGQRWPGLADTASLLRGALGTHLRRLGQGAPQRGWQDALALLSLAVPVVLVLVEAMVMALPFHPYRIHPGLGLPAPVAAQYARMVWGDTTEVTGAAGLALGLQVLVAGAVLLGRRGAALALTAATMLTCLVVVGYPVTQDLPLLTGSILEAGVLIAMPDPRRGRQLLRWRHVIALILTAAVVEAWSVVFGLYELHAYQPAMVTRPGLAVVGAIGVLTIAVAGLIAGLRLGWCLLLLAVLSYPFALQMTLYLADRGGPVSLLIYPLTTAQQAELYLPPVVLAVAAVVGAVVANHHPVRPAGPGRPHPT
jgi:hypothetical protein